MHPGQATTEESPPRPTRGAIRVGRLRGIDILVRPSWVVVAALICVLLAPTLAQQVPGLGRWSYAAALAFAVLLYGSVLLHELSHAFVARRFGLPVRSVTLHFLGGVTEIEQEPQTPSREFWVAVVGPLTSLAVAAAAFGLAAVLPDGIAELLVSELAVANVAVGALNLVPGLPLDGGRVLRAAVWAATGKPYLASTVAGWAGRVLALLVLGGPLILQAVTGRTLDLVNYVLCLVVAAFLWTGATQSLVAARLRRRLPGLRARTLARRAVPVTPDLPVSEGVRRAHEAQAGALVVVTGDGTPVGVVNEAAVRATPVARQPWVTCGELSRRLAPGLNLGADLHGEELVRAIRATPSSEYVLVEPTGAVYGVLATADVDAAFAAS